MNHVDVVDSFMSYREAGAGAPIVLLHGNPTSSHVWRNVMPVLAPNAHCLAPDLIGMGESGKPDIAYRYADHARYLDAWLDTLALTDVVLVGYDWGGILALDWASRHPDRVRGIVVFETFLREIHLKEFPPAGQELFRALRTPGVGEQMALEQNKFLPISLGHGVKHGLAETDRAVYFAPYPDAPSRRPLLQWPRELPIDGEPAEMIALVERNAAWLETTATPKLLLTFGDKGLSNSPSVVDWAKERMELMALGDAGHHAPEDAPVAIGEAIAAFISRAERLRHARE